MGIGAYDCEELEKLNENQRQELRDAVFRELAKSQEIRRILRDKTASVYERLKMAAK